MTPTQKSASVALRADGQGEMPAVQADAGPFVLNLCSSTTPMALPKAEQEELKRFSFFVSRRFEEGRERFRLHMGYFATLADAEEWLSAVRDIYPGAWAGEAPGKKLRARAVAAAAEQAQHAAGPRATGATPVVTRQVSTTRPPEQAPGEQTHKVPTVQRAKPPGEQTHRVPTVQRAQPPAQPPQAPPAGLNIPTLQAAASPLTLESHARTAEAPIASAHAASAKPAAPREVEAAVQAQVPAPKLPAPKPPASKVQGTTLPGTSVAATKVAGPNPPTPAVARAAGAVGAHVTKPRTVTQLMTAPETAVLTGAAAAPPARVPAAPAAVRTAAIAPSQTAASHKQAAAPSAAPPGDAAPARVHSKAKSKLPHSNVREVLAALDETTGETRMMPAPAIPDPEPQALSDTQVLKLLETRRADGSQDRTQQESGVISLLRPDDTGTVRALKQAVVDNAPVWFAVQLQWSVQPIELAKVPPLAIFSAYTLYSVEGSRDGRRWYGLRLGFFSDAIAAKQVAYYVRSEFNSVAVVPVSPQERTRATDVDTTAPNVARAKKPRVEAVDEFKLIDSDDAPLISPAVTAAVTGKSPPPRRAPPAGKTARPGGRVRARERRGPQSLEETLEILGADQLEMDPGADDPLNESGVRHLRVEVQKNSPFGRLLERLSEKVRKP